MLARAPVAGRPLVVLLVIGVVSVVAWMVVAGLVGQVREILAQATAGLEEADSLPGMAELDTDQALRTLGELVQTLVSGLLSGLGSVTVTVLIVGIVTGLFILLFLMKDWRLVTDGTAQQIAVLLGSQTAWAARSFRTPSTRSGATPGADHRRADERRRGRPGRAPARVLLFPNCRRAGGRPAVAQPGMGGPAMPLADLLALAPPN